MKKWTVYYRGPDGREATMVVEAASKPEVFAILKQKGVSAVRIVEGATAATKAGAGVPPSAKRALVAGLAVVILAAGAYFLFFSGSGKPEKTRPDKTPSAIKEVKPVVSKSNDVPEAKPVGKATPMPETDEFVKGVNTNGMTEAQIQRERERKKRFDEKRKKMIFSNASDQILAMILRAPPGHDFPPLPISPSLDRDFKESLKTPIVINDDDPENVKGLKMAVMKMRDEIQYLVEEKGMTVREIITEHQDLVRENSKIRSDAQAEARRIYESGDVEGAQKYVTTMNLALQQMDVEPIKMPGQVNEEMRQQLRDKLQAIKDKKNGKKVTP